MRRCVTGIFFAGILFLAVPATAQMCGDVNGDGSIHIGDVLMLIDGIAHPEFQSDGSFHAAEADCDGRAGITMSDVITITDYIFRDNDHRDCSASGTYSLTPAPDDTVFVPYIVDVPGDIDRLDLPVLASVLESTDGVYISLITHGAISGGLFLFGMASSTEESTSNYIAVGNTDYPLYETSMFIIETSAGTIVEPRKSFFELEFHRSSDGVANVAPTEFVRSPEVRITVEKDGDLFIPVIVYYEYMLPDPILSVDPTSLEFTAFSGRESSQIYEISFTSTERDVTFDLDISQPWLALDGAPAGPYTTPVSFWVTADATALLPANYAATITPVSVDPAETIVLDAAVTVDFTVDPEPEYPFGDLNCSGEVTIGDISLMIDCVFIDPRPIPDCR